MDLVVTEAFVRQALEPVIDPELGYSIVDLGLFRGAEVIERGRQIKVLLTLTSPMCPLGPEIIGEVRETLLGIPGTEHVDVELVWSPPWDPRVDCSEDLQAEMGIW